MSGADATVPGLTMPRFPTRTLVLMLLALLAFVWFWVKTHQQGAPRLNVVPVQIIDGGSGP